MKSIKELREKYGYTQQQLADLLDVSLSVVQKWERGVRNPGKRSMKDISREFPEDME